MVRENDEDVTLWRLADASREPETVRIRPTMCSNDGAGVREWAVAGRVSRSFGSGTSLIWQPVGSSACLLAGTPAAEVVAMLGTRFGRSARHGLSGHAAQIPCAGTLEAKDSAMTPGLRPRSHLARTRSS